MIIIVLVAVLLFTVWDVYRYIFWRTRPKYLSLILDKKGHSDDYYARRDSAAEELRKAPCEKYEIRSDRGEKLCGWYYPCGEEKSKKIAFIVHGYHSEHLETAGMFFEEYRKRGFDVFTCDNTASGESGGSFFGYDVFESADCIKWLYFLINEFGADIQVIMHGFSLGGATVLKMSDACPPVVKFIVSDSGFIDAREILKPSLSVLYPLFERLTPLLAGYSLHDTDVSGNVKNSPLPFLIVHGTDDPTVPFSMGKRIYELCPNYKDCLFVEGARHIESIHNAPKEYWEKLDAFIAKYMD